MVEHGQMRAIVSVIIPVYNRRHVISRALDSVLAQTLPADEIIVVDDGSTDGTADIVAGNYPMVKLIRQTNRGHCAARNAAIAESRGELLAFLDSDDAWLPDKLKAQVKVAAIQPDLGIIATQKYKNRTDYPIKPVSKPRFHRVPFTMFLKRTKFHPSSVMVPKRVLAELGCFDETLKAAEDRDLWLRIAYQYPVARIKQPLTAVFEGEDCMSCNRLRQYLSDLEVLAHWNPARQGTYDTEKRMTPLLYQRYIFSFAIIKSAKLFRRAGSEKAREFLSLVKAQTGLPPFWCHLLERIMRMIGLPRERTLQK